MLPIRRTVGAYLAGSVVYPNPEMRSCASRSNDRRLGLEVALNKSDALCFHIARRELPSGSNLTVGGLTIAVVSTIKYLGLVLVSLWNFGPHFKKLAPKLREAAGALSRLLANLMGPDMF